MASQGNKASVPYLHLCVSSGGGKEKGHGRRDERERLCSMSVQHLSPSWGCCDYLVEFASQSTQTKLTMANDPWTGIDSCRKCRQCSLHPEWIRYLHCIGPPSPYAPTHMYATNVIYLVVFWYQARMLSASRFCHIQNESVSENHSPLPPGLNGERWRCSKDVVITHRRYSRVCVDSVHCASKGRLYLVEV